MDLCRLQFSLRASFIAMLRLCYALAACGSFCNLTLLKHAIAC